MCHSPSGTGHRRRRSACHALLLLLCPVLIIACQKTSPTTSQPPSTPPTSTQDATQDLDTQAPVNVPEPSKLAQFTSDLTGTGALITTITTSKGAISCELFEKQAPITVTNFVGLATGQLDWTEPGSTTRVKGTPYYDGLTVSRVIPDFMFQAGDRAGDGSGTPGYTIPDEIVESLKHDQPGRLSMANSGPNTGGSQFFIITQAAPHLDGRHTIFGQCQPLDLLQDISRAPADAQDRPLDAITITQISFERAPE